METEWVIQQKNNVSEHFAGSTLESHFLFHIYILKKHNQISHRMYFGNRKQWSLDVIRWT